MNERRLSELQKEYRAFFLEKMRLYGVKSPAELAKEKKSEFFTEIRNDWSKHKLLKLQLKETNTKKIQPTFEEPLEGHVDKLIVAIETESPFLKEEWHQKDYTSQPFKEKKNKPSRARKSTS
jgi:hypothetical protein